MKHLILLFSLLVWLTTDGVAYAIYDLRADRESAGRVPVGILGVSGGSGLDEEVLEVRQVLMADLRRSTLFHARDLELHLNQSPEQVLGNIRLAEIGSAEAVEVLLWVNLERTGPSWVLSGHIYDGARGRLTRRKRVRGDESQLRQLVHRFVGELIFLYTGDYGNTRSRIAYVSDLSGTKEIYSMDYDGNAPMRATVDRNIALTPALSPDARKLLYSSQKSGGWYIYEYDLFSRARLVSLNLDGLNVAPDWHPKGDGYAVTASKDGNREIYHITKGRRMKRLTHHPGDDVSPSWSPDGKRLAFTSNRGGTPQIYQLRSGSGKPKRVTYRGSYNTEADWSPRDGLIAYTCRNDRFFHICVVEPNGKNRRQLTTGSWDDESPSFSPDGRHLAFSSARGGKRDIYIMDLDGSNVERLTFNGANNTSPDWAGPTTK